MKANIDFIRDLYGHYKDDERAMMEILQGYLKFFSGTIVSIMGGSLLLLITSIKSDSPNLTLTGIILIVSGILVVGISRLGSTASRAIYRRQLESIVKRAKIEDFFDLSNTATYGGTRYWKNEGLILSRYLEDILGYDPYDPESDSQKTILPSRQFVNDRLTKGFMKVTKPFYSFTTKIGYAGILIGLYYLFPLLKMQLTQIGFNF